MEKPIDICEINCLHEDTVALVKPDLLPDNTAVLLAETFKTLGDPTRIKIINVLSRAELCVCDLAHLLGMSQSSISHQLRLLRNLKLVKFRKVGKVVFYALADRHILTLFNQGLDHVLEDRQPE